MSDFSDKLATAISESENDMSKWTWKGPREYVKNNDGTTERKQEEKKLVDATQEELKKWYNHCQSMLYSNDKKNPGRYILIKQCADQREKCTAELYIRYLRTELPSEGKKAYPTHLFLQDLLNFISKPEILEKIPKSTWNVAPISSVIQCPEEYASLPINTVINAALDMLGIFSRKHITLTFLTKMGLCFTKQEIKEYLTKKDDNGKLIDKIEVLRDNLDLQDPKIKLFTNFSGGLSYLEFRAMINLKDIAYSAMSNVELLTLRNKVLFRLEIDARHHAELWEAQSTRIKKVAESKGWNLV